MRQLLLSALALAAAACAAPRATDSYATPVWTREYCAGQNWRQLGQDDAGRFEDRERRFAALNAACGVHFRVPRDEYMTGFAEGRARLGG